MVARYDIAIWDLKLLSNAIAERELTIRRGTLEIPWRMYDAASEDARVIFVNMCRIHHIEYKMVETATGPAWVCADDTEDQAGPASES